LFRASIFEFRIFMNLVIVESPAKGKTIEKYLGKDYKVLASFGHVRDLPAKNIGVDVKNDFTPEYIIPAKAKKVVSELKSEIAKSDMLYLATDYDREGEAIAWHLVEAIKPKKPVKRITFHEITKSAICEAIKHPREIDLNLVNAQQARRILDRLVGYKLSPFLWKKVAQGLSAGRVQSVAVRLIVDKEKEIQKFVTQEYWSLEAKLSKEDYPDNIFQAILTEKDNQKIDRLTIKNEAEAKKVLDDLNQADYIISDIQKAEKKRYPAPPFTTSTLQQEAGSKLHFSAKQTMRLAQNLYEAGLITYMRTDSVNVARQALDSAAEVIKKKFGQNYALSQPRYYKTKSKGAQEAHEAIRPTNLSLEVAGKNQEVRLYQLIWKKTIASQMAEAVFDETNLKIQAKNYGFSSTGVKTKFDGFTKLYQNNLNDKQILPPLEKGEKLSLIGLEKIQHFTEPPARYSEGTLIKELEKRGIGRPSTYAPTISTIQDRGYVEKVEGKFVPKDIGTAVTEILIKHFSDIIDYNFTAKMEEELDDIAEGKLKWQPVLKKFYDPFSKNLSIKMLEVQKSDLTEKTDKKCPKCGKNLLIKIGRYGKFLACGGYPECKHTQPLDGDITKKEAQKTDKKCPKCKKDLVLKESKYGKFLACSGYPDCKFTENIKVESKVKCPDCAGKIVQKRTRKGKMFWGCENYPSCKKAFWDEPQEKTCPNCKSIITLNSKSKLLKCSQCDWKAKED